MSEFIKLKVKKVIRETIDTISITFDIPENLKESFKYKSGQFLSIRTEIAGQAQSRAYSIASSPDVDDDVTVTVKEIEDGFVSRYINRNVHEADYLDVMTPRGKFTADLNPAVQRLQILFAAGSGITPIFSMLKSILEVEKSTEVILVYSNRSYNSIIYREELKNLEEKYNGRFKIIHFLSQEDSDFPHIQGRIDKEKTTEILRMFATDKTIETHYYMCGPKGMMNNIQESLVEFGVDKSFIHKEAFNSGKEQSKDCKPVILFPTLPEKKKIKQLE